MAKYYSLNTSEQAPLPDKTPTIENIEDAEAFLKDHIHPTHLDVSSYIKEDCKADLVLLKMENLQRTGSFKIRGAFNKIHRLSLEERARGIIAASAGNHAQGVALAANKLGVKCSIIMPEDAPLAKIQATHNYGTEPNLFGKTYNESRDEAIRIGGVTGATFIDAFDDFDVIAGQGTIGLEIVEKVPNVDIILVPIGGGGLISGIALAVKPKSPHIQIIGVQAEGCAAALNSLKAGKIVSFPHPKTIADGIKVCKIGEKTFAIMRRYVSGIITVYDEEIVHAMFTLQERCKLVVEGAGAVCVAALLGLKENPMFRGKKIVAILSGGNVDMDRVGGVIETGLVQENRTVVIKVIVKDTADSLRELSYLAKKLHVNIRHLTQPHILHRLPDHEIELLLTLETKNYEHIKDTLTVLKKYQAEIIPDPYASLI